MNVLYVEFNFEGHRLKYINAFAPLEKEGYNFYCLVPQKTEFFPKKRQIVMRSVYHKKRSIFTYLSFVRDIKRAVKEYKIDVVHILDGDFLYRYFAIGLNGLKRYNARLVVTYHHMAFGFLKRISLKRLFRVSAYGVAHTAKLKETLGALGIKNVAYIDYPMLDYISSASQKEARDMFGIKSDLPVLAFVGNILDYKGFDLLIEALNKIEIPCAFFAAGAPLAYGEEYIDENLKNPLVTVYKSLKLLSEEEFSAAILAGDVILLPYRSSFNGASGPLVNAAVHGRPVIGSDYGSLGDMIKTYSLGKTFLCDDAASLASAITDYIKNPFTAGKEAKDFAARSNVNVFVEKNKALYGKDIKNA